MGKTSNNDEYFHNKGQEDRKNSTGGRGQDNHHDPHKAALCFKTDQQVRETAAYNDGWNNHRNQKTGKA